MLAEWAEYERIEPFGAWRDNWHAALIAMILANAHRKPGSPSISMEDFFFQDAASVRERKDKQLMAFLSGFKAKKREKSRG